MTFDMRHNTSAMNMVGSSSDPPSYENVTYLFNTCCPGSNDLYPLAWTTKEEEWAPAIPGLVNDDEWISLRITLGLTAGATFYYHGGADWVELTDGTTTESNDASYYFVFANALRFDPPPDQPGIAMLDNVVIEYSDSGPGWTGYHNNIDYAFQPVTQDFGYEISNFAGGASTGEIGGTIVSSTTPAFYGVSVTQDFDDTLTCTGRFFVKDVYNNGGYTEQSWLWFGWFNSGFQGWQPSDFVGMGFPGARFPDHTSPFVQSGTGHGVADRARVDLQINEDDVAHTFDLQYDPSANGNKGAVTLSIDGTHMATINLQTGFKAQGADFDMFGIFANNLPSGDPCEIYFDDLVVNGTPYDFDSDPSWTGSGNNTTFADTICMVPTNTATAAPRTLPAAPARARWAESGGMCITRMTALKAITPTPISGRSGLTKPWRPRARYRLRNGPSTRGFTLDGSIQARRHGRPRISRGFTWTASPTTADSSS